MQPVEVFRLVKAIDIEPVLAVLPQLRFVSVNVGSINPRNKSFGFQISHTAEFSFLSQRCIFWRSGRKLALEN